MEGRRPRRFYGIPQRVDFVRKQQSSRRALTAWQVQVPRRLHRRREIRAAVIDNRIHCLQKLVARRKRLRRLRLVREHNQTPVAGLGQRRELRTVSRDLAETRKRRIPENHTGGKGGHLFFDATRVSRPRCRHEDIVAIALVNRISRPLSIYFLHLISLFSTHILDLGPARLIRIERKDAGLPEVALHLLDEAGVDTLADLILESDARLLLLTDDARHHLAVHLERVAADKGVLGNRKLEVALHHTAVRIREDKARLHATEERVLLDRRHSLSDRNRLLVRAQVDGTDHRRRQDLGRRQCAESKGQKSQK